MGMCGALPPTPQEFLIHNHITRWRRWAASPGYVVPLADAIIDGGFSGEEEALTKMNTRGLGEFYTFTTLTPSPIITLSYAGYVRLIMDSPHDTPARNMLFHYLEWSSRPAELNPDRVEAIHLAKLAGRLAYMVMPLVGDQFPPAKHLSEEVALQARRVISQTNNQYTI